jgi:hypothetical protein
MRVATRRRHFHINEFVILGRQAHPLKELWGNFTGWGRNAFWPDEVRRATRELGIRIYKAVEVTDERDTDE